MESNDENKKEVKSKIEQIRIDLEKKFAALELAKLKKSGLYVEKEKSDIDKGIIPEKDIEEVLDSKSNIEVDSVKEKNDIPEEEPTFEISDSIVTSISELNAESQKKDNTIVDKDKQNVKKEPNKIVAPPVKNTKVEKKEPNKIVVPPIKNTKVEKKEVKLKKEISEKKIILAKGAVINKDKTDAVKPNLSNEEEKKEKKSKLIYFIYGVAGILFLVVGYLVLDFYKDTKTFEEEKTERLISKYKNKSYLDSIELADANNQLLDYQNQYLIDSIANTYEVDLVDSSPKEDLSSNKKERDSKKTNSVKNKISNSKKKKEGNKRVAKKANNNLAKNDEEQRENKDENNEGESNTDEVALNDDKKKIVDNKISDIDKKTNEKEKPKKDDNATTENTVKSNFTASPVYPGCGKKRTELSKKKCLTSRMLRHVQKKFNSDLAQNIGLKKGVNKIKVSFVIDKNGYANVLYVRTQNKKIEKEAIRVIQSLPRMTPGRINGKIAQMKYVIPIQFKVRD